MGGSLWATATKNRKRDCRRRQLGAASHACTRLWQARPRRAQLRTGHTSFKVARIQRASRRKPAAGHLTFAKKRDSGCHLRSTVAVTTVTYVGGSYGQHFDSPSVVKYLHKIGEARALQWFCVWCPFRESHLSPQQLLTPCNRFHRQRRPVCRLRQAQIEASDRRAGLPHHHHTRTHMQNRRHARPSRTHAHTHSASEPPRQNEIAVSCECPGHPAGI